MWNQPPRIASAVFSGSLWYRSKSPGAADEDLAAASRAAVLVGLGVDDAHLDAGSGKPPVVIRFSSVVRRGRPG